MAEPANTKFFPALTGIRAFAAITVFLTHAGYILAGNASPGIQRYFNELSIGLPMFFVLTGFLITIRYYDNFKFTVNWANKFMISRFARLYPMYLLFTIVAFVSYHFNHNPGIIGDPKHPWFTVFLNLTFLRAFFDDLKFTGVGQGWSITVDVLYYLITPFVFFFIQRKKIFWLQPLIFVSMAFLLVGAFSGFHFYGLFGNITFVLYYTFFGRCLEIYMGMTLALNFNKIKFNPNRKIKVTYVGFILMFVCVYCFTLIPLAPGEKFAIKSNTGMILDTVFLSPAIVLLFFGLIREKTWLSNILSSNFMQLLGNAAYMFYLIHLGFINNFLHESMNTMNDWVFAFYDKHGLDWVSPFQYDQVNVFYVFIGIYALSIFFYKFMEEPLNKHSRNFLFKKLIHFEPRPDKPAYQQVADADYAKTDK